ncbi:borrelia burgdorferi REV family protein [Clostridioides difficile CD160]|nr:borrelia burgdorferi REV family protein [Clostridioides difficile CD160]
MKKVHDEVNKLKFIYYSNLIMNDILKLYEINNNVEKKMRIFNQNIKILYSFYSFTHEYRCIVSDEYLYHFSEKKLKESLDNLLLDVDPDIAYKNSLNLKNDSMEILEFSYRTNVTCGNKGFNLYKLFGLCACIVLILLLIITFKNIKSNLYQFVPTKDIKVSDEDKKNLDRNNLSLREAINSLPVQKTKSDEYKEYTNKYLSMKLKYPYNWEVKENISTIQNLVRESKKDKLFDLASDKVKIAGILVEFMANDPFETKISVGVSPLESNMNIQSLTSILDDNMVKQIDKQIRTNIQASGNKIISSKGTKIEKINENKVILSEYIFRADKENSNDTSVIQIICPNGVNNIVLTAISRVGDNQINKYNILTEMLKTLGAYDTNKELIEVG